MEVDICALDTTLKAESAEHFDDTLYCARSLAKSHQAAQGSAEELTHLRLFGECQPDASDPPIRRQLIDVKLDKLEIGSRPISHIQTNLYSQSKSLISFLL